MSSILFSRDFTLQERGWDDKFTIKQIHN